MAVAQLEYAFSFLIIKIIKQSSIFWINKILMQIMKISLLTIGDDDDWSNQKKIK